MEPHALGIVVVVQADQNPCLPAVSSGQQPPAHKTNHSAETQCQSKPMPLQPCDPDHESEDEHIDQGGAGIAGEDKNEAAEIGQHTHQFCH